MEHEKKTKNIKQNPFDVIEFGKRVAIVRQQILGLTQLDFATILNTSQAALSRLESGIGGNIHAVFIIVDYLNNNGYEGNMLFKKAFDIGLFTSNVQEIEDKEQLIAAIKMLQQQTNVSFENLLLSI